MSEAGFNASCSSDQHFLPAVHVSLTNVGETGETDHTAAQAAVSQQWISQKPGLLAVLLLYPCSLHMAVQR